MVRVSKLLRLVQEIVKTARHEAALPPALVTLRTIIIDGWERESTLPGLWVLAATTVTMLIAATCTYKRATA